MLYLYDMGGKLIRWNKKHEIMTDSSSEELSNMNLLDWYKGDAESQKRVTQSLDKMMEKGFADAETNVQKRIVGPSKPIRSISIICGIVEEYKGDIHVYSEMGKGTTFNLIKHVPSPVLTDIQRIIPTGTERILLVDMTGDNLFFWVVA